ncbi:hypothetical protein KC357_g302 [Hortaea werneckii]|nr:hypothetical protein KC357_g302 [Hortaea werneckii]
MSNLPNSVAIWLMVAVMLVLSLTSDFVFGVFAADRFHSTGLLGSLGFARGILKGGKDVGCLEIADSETTICERLHHSYFDDAILLAPRPPQGDSQPQVQTVIHQQPAQEQESREDVSRREAARRAPLTDRPLTAGRGRPRFTRPKGNLACVSAELQLSAEGHLTPPRHTFARCGSADDGRTFTPDLIDRRVQECTHIADNG